jgi:hypothetical protein
MAQKGERIMQYPIAISNDAGKSRAENIIEINDFIVDIENALG